MTQESWEIAEGCTVENDGAQGLHDGPLDGPKGRD